MHMYKTNTRYAQFMKGTIEKEKRQLQLSCIHGSTDIKKLRGQQFNGKSN